MARPQPKFTWTNYFVRLGAALLLVFATYNPTGRSYFHWAGGPLRGDWEDVGPLMALAGIVLIIGWAIFLRATTRSLGAFGTSLAVAFFAILIWLVVTWFPALADSDSLIYLLLLGVAGVLSTGISWSHVRRRVTGQIDVDEADI
jgi:hypothetical protein